MQCANYVVALAALITCVHGIGITVPGTHWCGPGNNAKNYDDLGSETELDKCCRAHDNCEEKIPPQDEGYGLSNEGLFPIFSCACEASFRQCLTSLRNFQSGTLGRIYFNTASVCIANGPPIVSCKENQLDWFRKRCLSYSVDTTQPPRWQFYDLAFYTHPTDDQEDFEKNLID